MLESQLSDLLDCVRGKGRYRYLGRYCHTYPYGDANQRAIYAGCCELEKRGLVRRVIDEPEHVCFGPTEEQKPCLRNNAKHCAASSKN